MSRSPRGADLDYTFITTEAALSEWAAQARSHKWLAFDTEFIGEKRFRTLVCLIQVATPDGLFLIDPLSIDDLGPFLDLVADPTLLKVTHAGENDYRLLWQNYGCAPRNLADTQLACGFLSDRYPVNFGRLAEEHIGVKLKKGFAVVDWTKRPIQRDALKYALEDVVYLREMLDVVASKLRARDRYEWFLEEMGTWEDTSRYDKTLLDETKAMGSVYKLRRPEKLFLIRMLDWRRTLAERRDHSREMVLATKDLNAVVKVMRNGPRGVTSNRHLKNKSWVKRHLDEWQVLYEREPTGEEEAMLSELRAPADTDIRQELTAEILYKYLSYHCLSEEIAIDLVVPRAVMRDLRTGSQDSLQALEETWRGEFLGDDVLELLANTEGIRPVLAGRSIRFENV